MEAENYRHTPVGKRPGHSLPGLEAVLKFADTALRKTSIFERGFQNAINIIVNEFELKLEDIPPEFNGYRILQLTDLHLDMIDGLDEIIAEAVSRTSADVCFLTGDYRDNETGPIEPIAVSLRKVLSALDVTDGVYAILGNHDDVKVADALQGMGARVLANETVYLRKGPSRILVTGLDDVSRFYTPSANQALAVAFEDFGVALVHSAEMAAEAAAEGYSLYICGHTHGGQICLPGGHPIITRLVRNRNYASGKWRHGNMIGYTSPGTGVSGWPVRFNSTGEVTVITLRR